MCIVKKQLLGPRLSIEAREVSVYLHAAVFHRFQSRVQSERVVLMFF